MMFRWISLVPAEIVYCRAATSRLNQRGASGTLVGAVSPETLGRTPHPSVNLQTTKQPTRRESAMQLRGGWLIAVVAFALLAAACAGGASAGGDGSATLDITTPADGAGSGRRRERGSRGRG